jgi:hypothetical protein
MKLLLLSQLLKGFTERLRVVVHRLRCKAGLIEITGVKQAFLKLVPCRRLKRALFPLFRARIKIAKRWTHASLILLSIGLMAQELSDAEITGIRHVCQREPKLQPLVEPPAGVVDCKDFELWLTLRKLGRTVDAHYLTRETYAGDSK